MPVIEGGTGLVTATAHDVLVGAGTSAITLVAPSATAGVPLVSGGASADPSYTTAVVAGGGTGAVTFTSHGVLLGNTTSAITATAAGTTGQVLTGVTGSAPTWQAAAGGSVTITGDSGSVSGSSLTLTGSTSGAVFTGSGTTLTESFNYLALPTTTSTNGLVSINGSAFMHNMNGGTFLGVGAGNLTSIPGTVTAIGSGAASINTSSDGHIVAIGDNAMHANTAGGFGVYVGTNAGYNPSGDFCTAVGYGALLGNAAGSGSYNTAIGFESLNILNGSGSYNCAVGWQAGQFLVSGAINTLIGADAGLNYTGAESNNINIGSRGVNAESNVLRIADGTGSGSQQLAAAYISGITGVVVTGAAAIISSGNQLGVLASSKQFKDDVQDMGSDSSGILKLRPVTFVWNKDSSPGLKDATDERQFGFIAEEAAEIMPSLIHYDAQGKPFSFKYNDMPAILLNELQKALKRIEVLEAKVGK